MKIAAANSTDDAAVRSMRRKDQAHNSFHGLPPRAAGPERR